MAITTDLQVANIALATLGVSGVADLTGGTYDAVDQDSFDTVIGDLLERHPWRFCRTYAALVATTAPAAQWTKAYTLPAGIIGWPEAVYTTSSAGARAHTDFELANGVLYTNAATAFIEYRTEPAVADWPSAFMQLARYALAAEWAIPVTENRGKEEFYTIKAFGTPAENGVGGQMGVAIHNDMRSEPMPSMFDAGDPIADARFATGETLDFVVT